MTGPGSRRQGTMATDRPQRYAKQLAGHWSGKGSVEADAARTVIRFDSGQVVTMVPNAGALAIEVSVPDGMDADRFAQVVADHLVRFGQRDELVVTWEGPPAP